ncbi:SDR family oxidoreductase [Chitinophaga pollutisoli]|uniref:SDR family oxidoreductase n=1 Tax=Chitinophaga pollutisoli TaxID=3133966 RepID=A0ABZ2YQM7_9BACT
MMKDNFLQLEGQWIWVFGGAGYLGQAVVAQLTRAGAKILCVDLDNRAASVQLPDQPQAVVIAASLDVANVDEIPAFVKDHVARYGVPAGMVNLTYASTAKAMEDLSAEDFDKVNHGGLTAGFILAREVGNLMREKGKGSIVLFSSIYGMMSPKAEVYHAPMNKNPIEYGVGKAGIIHMTKYLAVHWAGSNVRCNCISPGPFPNPTVQAQHPEFIARLAGQSPMNRIGMAAEIAGPVAFLLSDAASYITGHNLVVDGAWGCW